MTVHGPGTYANKHEDPSPETVQQWGEEIRAHDEELSPIDLFNEEIDFRDREYMAGWGSEIKTKLGEGENPEQIARDLEDGYLKFLARHPEDIPAEGVMAEEDRVRLISRLNGHMPNKVLDGLRLKIKEAIDLVAVENDDQESLRQVREELQK